MPTFATILFACLVLASPVRLLAQPQKTIIRTELLTLGLNGKVPVYYYKSGKEVLRLNVSSNGINPAVRYEGPPVLALYETEAEAGPVGEDEEPPKPLFRAAISKRSNRTLLVFAFTGKSKEVPSLKTYPIRDSSLGEGDYQIFNFSKGDIYGVFNDKKITVATGKTGVVRGSSWGDRILDLSVVVGVRSGDKVRAAYSGAWGHRPERRNFVFMFDSQNKRRPIKVKKYYDLPSIKAVTTTDNVDMSEPGGKPSKEGRRPSRPDDSDKQ